MKKSLIAILVAAASALAGCAGAPQNPQQAVIQTEMAYTVAARSIVAYKNLPPCSATVTQLCSKKEVVDQLKKADQVAYDAIKSAESAVRTPGFGSNVLQTAVTAAEAALKAFQSIISTSGVK